MPGKYEKEFLGLYTVIEQVDRTFLKDRFKNGKLQLLFNTAARLYLIDRIGPLRRALMREGVLPTFAAPRLMRGEPL